MAYRQWGSGTTMVVCLHGFGEDYSHFKIFSAVFGEQYTWVAIDIFYHGKSDIGSRKPDKSPWTIQEFEDFMRAFHKSLQVEKIVLLAYSLGGRLALKMLELMPDLIERAVLLAPDGLIRNPWYTLLTQSAPGRYLFRWFINHNLVYSSLLEVLKKSHLLSEKLYQFTKSQIATSQQQWAIYHTWTFLRHIHIQNKLLAKNLAHFRIPITLVMGEFDQVIPPKAARKLTEIYPATKFMLLPLGHRLLKTAVAEELKSKGVL